MSTDLATRSLSFAQEIQALLDATLPGERTMVSVAAEGEERYVVRPDGEDPKDRRIALTVGGTRLADLSITLYQSLDRTGAFLKTTRTDFVVHSTLDRTPLLRLEYRADMRSDPISHWQFHAERGAFTHFLSIAHAMDRVRSPHDLSKLHLPVGGERFRPCLEDVVEFLIRDCGVDHVGGWRQAVEDGRERWRRRQFKTSVRDLQEEAANVLRDHNWTVTPPDDGIPEEHLSSYRGW